MCASTNTLSPSSYARPSLRSWWSESPSVAAPVFFFQSKDAPAWVGRNEDSLLRAAGEKRLLVSATRGGSCAHPDQSRGLALRHKLRAISVSEHFLLILLFFLGGGVALHERLVGYAGLGARIHASGQVQRTGGITKEGRGELRTIMVEAAWVAVDHHLHWKGLFERESRTYWSTQGDCCHRPQTVGGRLARAQPTVC
jgi:transposase IS116/IS110/IS902 family protein